LAEGVTSELLKSADDVKLIGRSGWIWGGCGKTESWFTIFG